MVIKTIILFIVLVLKTRLIKVQIISFSLVNITSELTGPDLPMPKVSSKAVVHSIKDTEDTDTSPSTTNGNNKENSW